MKTTMKNKDVKRAKGRYQMSNQVREQLILLGIDLGIPYKTLIRKLVKEWAAKKEEGKKPEPIYYKGISHYKSRPKQ